MPKRRVSPIDQIVAAIWCRGTGNIIGYDDKIPWRVPSDLQRFKRITTSMPDQGGLSHCLVTRPTYESFPNRRLVGRYLYVLTRDPGYQVAHPDQQRTISSLEDESMLANLQATGAPVLFVIGGPAVYQGVFKSAALRPDILVDGVYGGEFNICPAIGTRVHFAPTKYIVEAYLGNLYRSGALDPITEEGVTTKILYKKYCETTARAVHDAAQIQTKGRG